MTITATAARMHGSAFADELRRRLASEYLTLVRARQAGDDLQAAISAAEVEQLRALADRNDVALG